MTINKALLTRSQNKCELCSSDSNLKAFHLEGKDSQDESDHVLICEVCKKEMTTMSADHWRCLKESMWSEHIPVQIITFRILCSLGDFDSAEQIYMEDSVKEWALVGTEEKNDLSKTCDSNGAELNEGDSVTLIKDLVVKGANFTAKRGTLVKNIRLTNNPKHIEGKVNGSMIVLVSKFLKKV